MPTTITGDSPKREQRLQQLLLGRIEQRFERRLSAEIRRAMNEAADDLENGFQPNIEGTHRSRLNALLRELWDQSARLLSSRILGEQRSARGPYHLKEVTPTQIMDGVMSEWIAVYGTEKITQITRTTQESIRTIITSGIQGGISEREIAKRIKEIAPTKSASRAQTIARTEVHASANASAQFSAEATGIEMRREWVASGGERTRTDHADADGQVVGMNEPFIVGGSELRYPGDPLAPAAQSINCRCAVAYVVE